MFIYSEKFPILEGKRHMDYVGAHSMDDENETVLSISEECFPYKKSCRHQVTVSLYNGDIYYSKIFTKHKIRLFFKLYGQQPPQHFE